MTVLLAGDIGGTKTILRLVKSELTSTDQELPEQTTLYEQTYASQEFSDLVPMVRQFLAAANEKRESKLAPEQACFGIAGAVVNNTSKLTNLSWILEASRLEQELQVTRTRLINDFVAVGYGVLGLSAQDLHTLQLGECNPNAPIAVIGAGTGLGQGFVIPQSGGYQVFATEGGHVDFAPRSQLEFELLHYILEKYKINRVSVERVVSGIGIGSIYQFLRDSEAQQRSPLALPKASAVRKYQESPTIASVFKTWEQEIGQEEKIDIAAEISKAALKQQDYLCEKTMELFVQAYGAEAGNLALKILPYGGLYIAGGIAAKILPLMQQGFMPGFLEKGRMRTLLEQVPVHIVLNPEVGLIGAALCAAQLTS